jgi:hypothetical protein
VDRHNSQFIRKLICDHINSNPYRYALTRDGRIVESKLPAAVQADLSSQLQRKLRRLPPDEPKIAAQANPLSTGHQEAAALPSALAETARKPRKPSLKHQIAAAEKATGKPVTSITLADGTKLDFGQGSTTEPENPWLAELPKETKQ